MSLRRRAKLRSISAGDVVNLGLAMNLSESPRSDFAALGIDLLVVKSWKARWLGVLK